jgi:antitoxin MazE
MKTHLVRIRNSRGVRLPKALIAQAGLTEEVDLRVERGAIVIARLSASRSGWAEAARKMRQRKDDQLLDPLTPTRFDDEPSLSLSHTLPFRGPGRFHRS